MAHSKFTEVAKKSAIARDDRTLAGLRRRAGLTQHEVADRLDTTWADIAALEADPDPSASRSRAFIEALER